MFTLVKKALDFVFWNIHVATISKIFKICLLHLKYRSSGLQGINWKVARTHTFFIMIKQGVL